MAGLGVRRAAGAATVCALVALVALEAVARGPAHTELFGGFVGEEGPMLAGWGSRLPGVANLARAHVHEYGAHKFHDGDGLWQSEHNRRGPWFWEVTPADRAKLREVNVDNGGPIEQLPLKEMAEAIDDPFDDEQPQNNYFSEGALQADADEPLPVDDFEENGEPVEMDEEPESE